MTNKAAKRLLTLSAAVLFITIVPSLALASESASEQTEHLASILPMWSVLPFVGILASIALLPLVASHWWEHNFGKVSFVLALPVGIYFLMNGMDALTVTAHEYVSFIILLGSLFVISGGIMVRGSAGGAPLSNTLMLFFGALISNLVGTTGASMLLIRPLIRANKDRKRVAHIVIFFIFMVSNVGGSLTPIGDPPLFLGYLKGVPFFWTLKLWPMWLTALTIIALIFFVMDTLYYKREEVEARKFEVSIAGSVNLVLLLGVIGSVFLPTPFRELGMLLMGAISMFATPKGLREENEFNFAPIKEVAILFAGIFTTMMPALLILQDRGAKLLGLSEPWHFFWSTGVLSSFLDNAPTYLAFLSAAQGLGLSTDLVAQVGVPATFLSAISLGAVFMGANSYIGNGPNFMVKAIAEQMDVKMPSFLGYMAYSAIVLIPVFILVTLVFFL